MIYTRPIAMTDAARPAGAFALAGGWCWFDRVECLERGRPAVIVPARDLDANVLRLLTAPRPAIAGLSLDAPRLMGILNVTPDSFSDGGRYNAPVAAVARAIQMQDEGAEILDIGGESTRPGAALVSEAEELSRTAPVIAAIRAGSTVPISIDTRKAAVAIAAVEAGASLINDVSAFSHDPALPGVVSASGLPVCLMHALGTPDTMQADPKYDDVLLDVYDHLADRVQAAVAAGIPRCKILVDPGIGFGKTLAHNLALLRGLSLLHGLGCGILLGASRKRFIGTIGGGDAEHRMAGSVAVALAGVAQGVQVLRVHDIAQTRQALRLWQAIYNRQDKGTNP